MSDKRKCVACGTEYNYCPTCAKYANLPKWMWKCDTETCNELFDVVSAFKMGIKTLDDVKDIVSKYNITDYSVYSQGIQNVLNQITVIEEPIKVEPVFKSKKKKKWYDTIEETPVVEEPISVDIELNDNVVEEPIDNKVDSFNEGISEE